MSRAAKDAAFDTLAHLPSWLPVAERLVWMIIADRINDKHGYAWCSSYDLAARTGLTPGAVRHCVTRLEVAGLVDVERRPGRTNRYRIGFPNPRLETRPTRVPGRGPASIDATPASPDARNQLENQLENLAPTALSFTCAECGGPSRAHRWRCDRCQEMRTG